MINYLTKLHLLLPGTRVLVNSSTMLNPWGTMILGMQWHCTYVQQLDGYVWFRDDQTDRIHAMQVESLVDLQWTMFIIEEE